MSLEIEMIMKSLADIQGQLEKLTGPKLGPIPKPSFFDSRKLYCNRSKGCCWYELTQDKEVVPFPHEALLGFIREVRFEEVTRRGKQTYKLLVLISADTDYLLEAGYDSFFSRGFLLGIAMLDRDILRKPIAIYPEPGDGDEVLFCRLYVEGHGSGYVKTPALSKSFIEETNWREVSLAAIRLVELANK